MHIAPQSQPTLDAIHRTVVSTVALGRTLLAYAQAADWNGRTLTCLLLSTWLCNLTEGRFENFQDSIVCPARRKFLRLRARMARSVSHTARQLTRSRNQQTFNSAA
jgi:hypothetical protein